MKKILIFVGIIISLGCTIAFAGPSHRVFKSQIVIGENAVAIDRATSTAYNIDGVTEIGYDYYITQGTSTPHISIGYQTSMDKATWTASTYGTVDTTSAGVYTATDSAITIPPTEWIRWVLKTELLNAVDTRVDLFFKTKNEGGR